MKETSSVTTSEDIRVGTPPACGPRPSDDNFPRRGGRVRKKPVRSRPMTGLPWDDNLISATSSSSPEGISPTTPGTPPRPTGTDFPYICVSSYRRSFHDRYTSPLIVTKLESTRGPSKMSRSSTDVPWPSFRDLPQFKHVHHTPCANDSHFRPWWHSRDPCRRIVSLWIIYLFRLRPHFLIE